VANVEQAEAWNGDNGAHWAGRRDRYEAMLAPYAARLLTAAAIAPGETVLDVGCGCGQTTVLAAARANPGQVKGVDLSAPMLAQARTRAAAEGVANAVFEQADVQAAALGQEVFDVAVSRFGVMFFDDPDAAFRAVRRALRPGGRLAFLCWQQEAGNDYSTVARDALAPFGPKPPPVEPGAPGPFSLADPDRIRRLLEGAGFTAVGTQAVTEALWVGADAEDALDFFLTKPSSRRGLKDADAATAAAARAALHEALALHPAPDGVRLASAAWVVTATR
jgi:SAM-dependent methyltransferase